MTDRQVESSMPGLCNDFSSTYLVVWYKCMLSETKKIMHLQASKKVVVLRHDFTTMFSGLNLIVVTSMHEDSQFAI